MRLTAVNGKQVWIDALKIVAVLEEPKGGCIVYVGEADDAHAFTVSDDVAKVIADVELSLAIPLDMPVPVA